ncbi:MAG: germination protein YpeB [Oscillospiraceae bacterium]|nr:germination protein YpeB [Oscillospiraceae bacterium]
MHFFSTKRSRQLFGLYLAAAFAVTAGFGVQSHIKAAAYQHLLTNQYQHAFAELSTAVSELDIALQKGQYATTPVLASALCTQAYGKAMSAQMAIGELPYGNVELEQTASFLAKAGDYAMYLARAVQAGGGFTQEQRETLQALAAAAAALSGTIQSLQSDLSAGALTLEDLESVQNRLSRAAEDGGQYLAGSTYQTVESDFPEVPSLIYDGPFSEHIAGQTPKQLEGLPEISQDEARARAAQFLNLRPEIFASVSDGAGQIPTWSCSAMVDGGEVYVEVTKQGGRVLEVLSARTPGAPVLSREEAAAAAARFLEAQGYPSMTATYSMDQGNTLTVNFAATQGEMICYPDLVKVSIALDTGGVVGFEAQGYLMNHTERTFEAPAITLAQAQTRVGPGLHILSHQLALIPTGGGYEVLCHEFKCRTADERHYILYVNAQTGQEEKILLLLEDERGTLAI